MKRILLTLALLLPAARADELADRFLILTGRNIFNAARRPALTGHATGDPAPPQITATLVGVVILDGTATAVFLGTTTDWTGARLPGTQLGTWTVTAVDSAGVTLSAADQTRQLTVGATLQQAADDTWSVTTDNRPATVTTTTTATESNPTNTNPTVTTPATTADPGDILKRLRERRQQEMKQ